MRQCRYCNFWFEDTEFEIANIIKGVKYRRRKCRTCYNAAKDKRRIRIRRQVLEIKSTLQCERCGFSDSKALVFHHRDPKEKRFTIGEMSHTGLSIQRIKKEMAKCDVLCANCHAIEHFGDWES